MPSFPLAPLRAASFLLAFVPSLAAAELNSQMVAYVVEADANGAERYTAAATVEPGQVIEYRLQHVNGFDEAIGGVIVTGPVPEGSAFIAGRAASDVGGLFEVRGEFDPDRPGEEWSTLPAQRIVVGEDGVRTVETARPEHYTAVRWTLDAPMPRGGIVNHAYRVRVD